MNTQEIESRVKTLHAYIAREEAKAKKKEIELSSQKKEQDKRDANLRARESFIKSKENLIDRFNSDIVSLKKSIVNLKKDKDSIDDFVANARKQSLDAIDDQLKDIKKLKEQIKDSLRKAEDSNKLLQNERESLAKEEKTLTDYVEKKDKGIHKMQRDLSARILDVTKKEKQIESRKSGLDILENHLNNKLKDAEVERNKAEFINEDSRRIRRGLLIQSDELKKSQNEIKAIKIDLKNKISRAEERESESIKVLARANEMQEHADEQLKLLAESDLNVKSEKGYIGKLDQILKEKENMLKVQERNIAIEKRRLAARHKEIIKPETKIAKELSDG